MAFQGKFDVVGMGCCAADTLCIYEGPIEEDQKMQVSGITRQGGGLVATGLVAVARLGGTARYIGKVGDDDNAQFVIREFKREGVDTSCVRIMPRMSCVCAIGIINPAKGFRTLFYCTDNAPLLEPGEMDRDEVLSGRVIFLDGFQLKAALQAARWGRDAGRPILMDAELTGAGSDELADIVTHVVASLGYAKSRVGDCEPADAARRLFKKLSARDPDKVVAVTAGSKGSYFVTRGEEFHQPAFQVPVVDTTGCGDVFHGAFAFGMAKGMDLRKTAEFASAVAALKCRKLGGRAGIPSLAETEKLIASNRPKRAQ